MRIHLAIGLLVLSSAMAAAQAPAAPAAPTGDAKHGRELFESSLRCYACHGYDGQTGSPRLVPMARPQDAFVAYVRKPSGRGMPSFAATPERDLVDVPKDALQDLNMHFVENMQEVLDLVLALQALKQRIVPGIATLISLDPALAPFPVSDGAQKPRSDVALVLCRGFAGMNVALVVRAG